MRKILSAAMLAAMALAFAPAHAATETGSVLVPTAGTARLQRCAGADANGVFGYILDVTGGASFSLAADSDADINDFDIAFYKSLTSCEADADAVAAEGDHENVAGDETGTVPADANVAIVTLFVGVPGAGFTYTE